MSFCMFPWYSNSCCKPCVRTFESFEIFTEMYLRIPFVLGVMLQCRRSWSLHVAFICQASRSAKIVVEPFLAFCRSLEPLKMLMINLKCFFKAVRTIYSAAQCHISEGWNHKIRHPRCVYNKLDWSLYTCLTQLCGGIDMYNLLHKDQLHVSALFIGHLQVDKWRNQ